MLIGQFEILFVICTYFIYLMLIVIDTRNVDEPLLMGLRYTLSVQFILMPAHLFLINRHDPYVSMPVCRVRFCSERDMALRRAVYLLVETTVFVLPLWGIVLLSARGAGLPFLWALLLLLSVWQGFWQVGVVCCAASLKWRMPHMVYALVFAVLTFDAFASSGIFAFYVSFYYEDVLGILTVHTTGEVLRFGLFMMLKTLGLSAAAWLLFRGKIGRAQTAACTGNLSRPSYDTRKRCGMKDHIRLEHVSKTLKGRRVLNDIDFTLERGRTYVFFGRNASGKTMLLRAVAGLLCPDAGRVVVFGQRVSEDRIFPANMGIIIETIGLWKHLTGFDNLALIAGIRNVATPEDIRTALVRVGLDPEDKRKYRAFSMGMRQKLALAQAIMEKPELLILDEPTNGLDEESVERFRALLTEERRRGVTCLLATHQMDDVRGLYDGVYRLKDGACLPEEEVAPT
jgi:ABC-2 type transport system ATP-binding protein